MTSDGRVVVAQITQTLGWGGLERVALDLCTGLDRTRYQPVAISLSDQIPRAEQFAAADVPVEVVAQKGLDATLPWRLARCFRRLGVDVVQGHNFGRFFYAGPAALLAGRRARFYTEHSNTLPHERALLLTQRRLSRLAPTVVAVSPTVRRVLVEQQGLPPDRVVVIPNGIAIDRYAHGDGAALRASCGVPAEALVIGHVGRFVSVKNHALLLRAFARLFAREPAAWLLLAGDGELRGDCERLAGELGVAERVRFLGVRDDIPDVLAAFDVFALSSDSEGLPLAILEAMAAGRPTVATHGAGKDVITPETGVITANGDGEALAVALTDLLAQPERRRAMGQAAVVIARERYSVSAMVSAYCALYETLLEPYGRR